MDEQAKAKQEPEAKQEAKIVWTLAEDSHLVTLIATINDKSIKAGKDAHSVEYWCEELLARGATTYSNYLDADRERRNRESFTKEMSKLTVPNGTDAIALAEYAQRVAKISAKFGIGGTQVEVK